jgi:hypothetical protein
VFAVNIPLAVLGLALAVRWLPQDQLHGYPRKGLLAELDLPGVLLFAASVSAALGFLLSVGSGPRWALLAAVPVVVAGLVWRELRTGTPFLDLRALARNRGLTFVLAQQVAVQVVFYSIFFGLPMWLERVRHFPPASTGLLLLPIAAFGVVVTPIAARLATRIGAWLPLVIGSAGLVGGSAGLLFAGAATPAAGLLGLTALIGLPNGFNNMGLQALLYRSTPVEQTGVAAGLFQTGRYIGAISSTALLGIVFADGVSTAGLHRVVLVTGIIAVLLVGAASRSVRFEPH